ncbi:hypothetical protein [Paracidobacterium acidisoli]|uniref:Uncharacterized protein n=1 Tax=Paracidobacterium acidisoli TaxID=2303751 RepID=A0A372IML1_9BACT|nr:hypothetical protein [Paracidobacterium acidisoli]MBT9331834.1 hypothetical protein [Paracidobacterium acidisoli]
MKYETSSGHGRRRGESAVDRLIELATDEKPSAAAPKEIERAPHEFFVNVPDTGAHDGKDLEENPMWKMLLQFKSVLPYVARLLPLLDLGAAHAQSSALSTEVKQHVGELQTSQRDLRLALQDQTLQLKRFEEQVTRVREATERNAFEHSELVEDVKSIHSLIRTVTGVLGTLLVILIVMVGFLIFHFTHLLR